MSLAFSCPCLLVLALQVMLLGSGPGAAGVADSTDAAYAAGQSRADVQYFHGTVTHVDARHIMVSRALVGRRPESHTFLISRKTRMNRGVHLHADVTVRYQQQADGDLALYIQVHHKPHPARSTQPLASGDAGDEASPSLQ